MLENAVEHKSDVIVHNDIVQTPEQQSRKKNSKQKSSFPDGPNISVHVSEVLRQVEGTDIEPKGWIDWDSWFGSVSSCTELKKRMDVSSTFIVKNNT